MPVQKTPVRLASPLQADIAHLQSARQVVVSRGHEPILAFDNLKLLLQGGLCNISPPLAELYCNVHTWSDTPSGDTPAVPPASTFCSRPRNSCISSSCLATC